MPKGGTIENHQPAKEFLYSYFIKISIDLTQLHLSEHEAADVKYIPYREFITEFMKERNEYIPYPKRYKVIVKKALEALIGC